MNEQNGSMNAKQVLALIVEVVRENMPELSDRELTASDSLEEMGANSMDRAEIVMAVLERMKLAIPLVETYGPENIGQLAQLLYARRR